MYDSIYAKLPDPLSHVWRLKGVACETILGPVETRKLSFHLYVNT